VTINVRGIHGQVPNLSKMVQHSSIHSHHALNHRSHRYTFSRLCLPPPGRCYPPPIALNSGSSGISSCEYRRVSRDWKVGSLVWRRWDSLIG
jgi:hypothetical protein